MKSLFLLLLSAACVCYAQQAPKSIPEPEVVGVPPVDAGRGLIRVNAQEIRHYDGDVKTPGYLLSNDNGKTWNMVKAVSTYPPSFANYPKEAPSIVRNPNTGEYIRVQPVRGFIFISEGGLDGIWKAVTKDGKLEANWQDKATHKNLKGLDGIMRTPIFVQGGKRILVPSHNMGAGTQFHISDDGGLTWRKSKGKITSPKHDLKPPHQCVHLLNNALEVTVL